MIIEPLQRFPQSPNVAGNNRESFPRQQVQTAQQDNLRRRRFRDSLPQSINGAVSLITIRQYLL